MRPVASHEVAEVVSKKVLRRFSIFFYSFASLAVWYGGEGESRFFFLFYELYIPSGFFFVFNTRLLRGRL